MENTKLTQFNNMRQHIIQTTSSGIQHSPFDDSYIFAWSAGVYPAFNTAIDMHQPYEPLFNISKCNIYELASFLEHIWNKGEIVSFWQFEQLFKAYINRAWNRQKLIDGCRYLYLTDFFDKNFWNNMLKGVTAEPELLAITRPLENNELLSMCA